ncbi:MAG TPA: T9SS type A sorting domain-containing protein, partial [Ignavibacteriaceae bacterium]|nr:T9SS type A sorting domain-containing protein [Ignavibacteriaceae bacterium]
NPVTQIKYSIPEDGFISLRIYNLLGQQIAELVNGIVKAGNHKVTFDGSYAASGVYYYRLEAGNVVLVKKMLLIK